MYLFLFWSQVAGFTVEAARQLSLTLGLLGVAVATLLARGLVSRAVWNQCAIPLFCAVLLSSWVLVPHRLPIEMTCTLLTVGLLLAALRAALEHRDDWKRGVLLGICWGILPYVYHSLKFLFVVTPVLVLLALILEGRESLRPSRCTALLVALGTGLALFLPVAVDLTTAQRILTRYRDVQQPELITVFLNYWKHCNPVFWFVSGDANPRHHSGVGGMFNPVLAPFLFAGFWAALTQWRRQRDPFIGLVPVFFLASFVPASSSNEGLPHALRTLLCVPPAILLFFLGAEQLGAWLRRLSRPGLFAGLCGAALLVGGLFAGATLHGYFNTPLPEGFDQDGRLVIDPAWLGPERILPCSDRSLDGIPYRYVRLVLARDLCYCDPQFFRKEPWMDE